MDSHTASLRLLYLGREWSLYEQVRQAVDRRLETFAGDLTWALQRVANQDEAAGKVAEWQPQALFLELTPSPNSRARFAQTLQRRFSELCLIGLTQTPDVSYRFPFHLVLSPPILPSDLDPLWERLVGMDRFTRLTRGPFTLDLATRTVQGPAGEARLSPKLCRLLQVLLTRAGETLERAELMRQVWETDFTEDTRTLEVHIRWLRQRIEPEPSAPRYLQTVRGVGYRLVVEP